MAYTVSQIVQSDVYCDHDQRPFKVTPRIKTDKISRDCRTSNHGHLDSPVIIQWMAITQVMLTLHITGWLQHRSCTSQVQMAQVASEEYSNRLHVYGVDRLTAS